MRALTVCQPYAHLIMTGAKRVENRTWSTKYRGRLYIHAGRSKEYLKAGLTNPNLVDALGQPLALGAVIAIVTLLDCLTLDEIRAGKHDAPHPWLRTHEHTEGPWCWVFDEHPTPIGPWRWKGSQGLFDIHPDALNRQANTQLGNHESGDGV